ncbi:hypothetical protein ACFVUS_01125 [Nocardia sp. NPDC058058]|uniref:hypothetical protein n=1 Tax=Nocardia sp. NPDC058058 TaxID=3346317 RepID=UPI0036DB99FB
MGTSHQPPDYPVMNLETARRGLAAHRECDDEICSARAYFEKRVARLERELRTVRSSHDSGSLRGAWNIWGSGR